MAKFLLALAVPAMVYFFFVFYGGQREAFKRKAKTAAEIADLIERFLNGASLYPQEWNDFVESLTQIRSWIHTEKDVTS